MYKVNLWSEAGEVVETGTYLVCAKDKEAAELAVCGYAGIPPSSARLTTNRVKPSLYELLRSEYRKAGPSAPSTGEEPDGAVHEIRASAKVFAYREASALRRFSAAIIDHAASRNSASPHVNELLVEIERADHRPRPSRVEEQSIYKERRFFPGGAARPR